MSEKFCASCGHAMDQHQRATQATIVQRACSQCTCANFTGAPGAQFCATCGHGATSHLSVSPADALAARMPSPYAAQAVPVTMGSAIVTKKPRPPFPTAKIVNFAGIAVIAVVIIIGTALALSWVTSSADNAQSDADARVAAAQQSLDKVTKELDQTKKDAASALVATKKLEKKIRSAKNNRARLPRQIAALRAQQRQLRETINGATYQPVPRS